MFTSNPFAELSTWISPSLMQAYVIVMIIMVAAGTIIDVLHKKSAKYFSENMRKSKALGTKEVGGGEMVSIAIKTAIVDVAASGEFCDQRRRITHLLTMYGFVLFAATTAIMIFGYIGSTTPAILPLLWHAGALMLCVGGYWFWFFIRVDVAAEGNAWYRVIRADLFILSLLATATFGLIWSALQAAGVAVWSALFFFLFIFASTVLFGGVLWSKFAHMFFFNDTATTEIYTEADGSRDGLPEPADQPEQFGPGIKRLAPKNY